MQFANKQEILYFVTGFSVAYTKTGTYINTYNQNLPLVFIYFKLYILWVSILLNDLY